MLFIVFMLYLQSVVNSHIASNNVQLKTYIVCKDYMLVVDVMSSILMDV